MKVEPGEFPRQVLLLLEQDGGSYLASTLAEEFGGTLHAANQSLLKMEKPGLLKRDGRSWALTESGVAEARRLKGNS